MTQSKTNFSCTLIARINFFFAKFDYVVLNHTWYTFTVIEYLALFTLTLFSLTGFNALCEAYGFDENPLKDSQAGATWQRTNLFADAEELPEDLVTRFSAA